MSERIQLQEEHLDKVVGGAFQFYKNKAGEYKCLVDGYGVYNSTENGFFDYINLKNAHPDANGDELFDLCMAEGIIW